ncbi:hypothetical protein N7481_006704 [Penicillium waksmanii]|uniref:uncharacterized protein n=1 Tax=Penicillium waksmanii TaxID=69791 RepID=UPI002547C6F7|nr:uncharacterized protein N7481_006704 [Penicillium waksmanii]KAJ5984605.1 hypothetical protein N7481_006704 [Penicillium waksmanii]
MVQKVRVKTMLYRWGAQRSVWGDGVYTSEVNKELILTGSVISWFAPPAGLSQQLISALPPHVTWVNETHNVTCTHVTRPRSASADPPPNPNISSELVLLRTE